MNQNLAAILVYKPSKNIIKLVDQLIEQNCDVLLLLNSKEEFLFDLINRKKLRYINNKINIGVAESLNNAIKYFLGSNFRYLITFDQDSLLTDGYISSMIQLYEDININSSNIACLSPSILDVKFSEKNQIYKVRQQSKDYDSVDFAITSGSLFDKNSFIDIGNMNEKLFIDGVDVEWCQRAKNKGLSIIKARNIFLSHKIGTKFIKILGMKKSYHDNDIRVYYIIRNYIYLIFSNSTCLKWKIKEIYRILIRIFAYPILSSNKCKTLKFVYLGIKDSLFSRMGKMTYIEH